MSLPRLIIKLMLSFFQGNRSILSLANVYGKFTYYHEKNAYIIMLYFLLSRKSSINYVKLFIKALVFPKNKWLLEKYAFFFLHIYRRNILCVKY